LLGAEGVKGGPTMSPLQAISCNLASSSVSVASMRELRDLMLGSGSSVNCSRQCSVWQGRQQ